MKNKRPVWGKITIILIVILIFISGSIMFVLPIWSEHWVIGVFSFSLALIGVGAILFGNWDIMFVDKYSKFGPCRLCERYNNLKYNLCEECLLEIDK